MLEHHCITRGRIQDEVGKGRRYNQLCADKRNLIPVQKAEHDAHHGAGPKFPLSRLPDSVFEFGVELMGEGKTYNYFRRYYSGEDKRLEALLGD